LAFFGFVTILIAGKIRAANIARPTRIYAQIRIVSVTTGSLMGVSVVPGTSVPK
jgi:hypothetical protein